MNISAIFTSSVEWRSVVLKMEAFSNYGKASCMEKKSIEPMIQKNSITDPALMIGSFTSDYFRPPMPKRRDIVTEGRSLSPKR